MMGLLQFHHRKMIKESITVATQEICADQCKQLDEEDICLSPCLSSCPDNCKYPEYLSPPPPPPSLHHASKPNKFLIISVPVLAAALLALFCYAFYVKFYLGWYSSRRRSRSRSRLETQTINQTHDDFLDEDHGPMVDHHIWHIQTVGLQPSVISAITVCKYKRGDGLVEGTECSVCLNEFQEDETLRLLPKCNHAFHIPCIDTWLRSHTNCPLCRAPIVKIPARASSSAATSASASASATPNSDNLESRLESGDAQIQDPEENRETETRLGDGVVEEEVGEIGVENRRKRFENSYQTDDEMQPMRRSVSLDDLSASKISQDLANLNTQLADNIDSSTEIVAKRVGRSDSLARFVATSSIRRSLSCSGKFLLSRSSRSQNSD